MRHMTKNNPRFNRDYAYVSRLTERSRSDARLLVEPKVQKRLSDIAKYWHDSSEALHRSATELLETNIKGVKQVVGSKALVKVRAGTGYIKVLCQITAKTSLFNRYEVSPIGGQGKAMVAASSIEFID